MPKCIFITRAPLSLKNKTVFLHTDGLNLFILRPGVSTPYFKRSMTLPRGKSGLFIQLQFTAF